MKVCNICYPFFVPIYQPSPTSSIRENAFNTFAPQSSNLFESTHTSTKELDHTPKTFIDVKDPEGQNQIDIGEK